MYRVNPAYAESVKKMVLEKLSKNTQKEYEDALKQYKKNIRPSLAIKTKEKIDQFVLHNFSFSSAKKISNFYRTIIGKDK